jgi:hypothetical protein
MVSEYVPKDAEGIWWGEKKRNKKQKRKRLKSKQNKNQITSYQEIINKITENYIHTKMKASAVQPSPVTLPSE